MVYTNSYTINAKFADNFLTLQSIITLLQNIDYCKWRHPELGYTEQYVMVRYWCSEQRIETSIPLCAHEDFATSLKSANW